jgi:hypothetical protein
MNRYIATFTALLLASSGLTSIQAQADHRDRTIRVQLPIHQHGQQTLKLRRMIGRHTQLDLDGYRLKSVVLKSGRNSHGYASLRVGGHRSGPVFVSDRNRIRIDAPGNAGDRWRLRLGSGTRVRSVIAVLEPRRRHHDYRAGRDPHDHHAFYGHAHPHRYGHGAPHYRIHGRAHDSRQRAQDSKQRSASIDWRSRENAKHRSRNRGRDGAREQAAQRDQPREQTRDRLRDRDYPRLRTHHG